jgi:uncharacterized damage-inducible protein DinB
MSATPSPSTDPAALPALISEYLAGPAQLRAAVTGMSEDQLDASPIPGKWSTRQVVCHLADFEPIYADRMKRILAENEPTLPSGDQNLFAAHLAYAARDVNVELRLIESVRQQVARILSTIPVEAFQRRGIHSEEGPMTLEFLLRRITGHIPHHLSFIREKRRALGVTP